MASASMTSESNRSAVQQVGRSAAPVYQVWVVVVITVIPALVVYPFVQRHFTKGTLTGAVKG
jgi:putative aldouronate transport system permease protein